MNRMSIPSGDSLLRIFVCCAVLYCTVRTYTITNNIITVSIKYILVTMLWLLLHGCNFFFSSSLPVIFPKTTQIEHVGCLSFRWWLPLAWCYFNSNFSFCITFYWLTICRLRKIGMSGWLFVWPKNLWIQKMPLVPHTNTTMRASNCIDRLWRHKDSMSTARLLWPSAITIVIML